MVEKGDVEGWQHERREAKAEQEGGENAARGDQGFHSSSSRWWLVRERQSRTGMIRVNTMTSL